MIDNNVHFELPLLKLRLWMFDYDNPEWERVRSLCLEEDNWLRQNYTQERCKISDHKIFFILYDETVEGTSTPAIFGGIKEYTPDVARMLNRYYTFPKYRTYQNTEIRLTNKYELIHVVLSYLEKALETSLGFKYNLLFMSMQNRERTYRGHQTWWKFISRTLTKLSPEWKVHNKLIQTVEVDDPTCWQNIMYRESENFKFEDWNPNTMSFEEYEQRYENDLTSKN